MPATSFLKISTCHDILGPRLTGRIKDGYCGRLLRGFSPEQAMALFHAVAGHRSQVEPPFDQLADEGLSAEYLYRETRRAVDGIVGESAIYAGIAIDVPRGADWGTEPSPRDPDEAGRCVRRTYDAGAAGSVICREYEEMHEASLRAIGQAVRERAAG